MDDLSAKYAVMAMIITFFLAFISLASVPALLQAESTPQGVIIGYILDENGAPVSAANVTLWEDGKLWERTKYIITPSNNPQTSNIYNNNEGHFLFGYVFPGIYTVIVEKDGFQGSATESVGYNTVTVNVTLGGYRVPAFSPEQLSYAGAITGTVYELSGHAVTDGANVSLWQCGRMLKLPANPQTGSGETYRFEHLAPGQYEVRAVMLYPVFENYPANISVNVSDRLVTADLVLPFRGPYHDVVTPTASSSTIQPTSPSPTSAISSAGTPFQAIVTVLLSMGIAVLIILIYEKQRR